MPHASSEVPATRVPATVTPAQGRVTAAIIDFIGRIPHSQVDGAANPDAAARAIGRAAAQKAALTAGSLALPPGPLGWLTVLPELIAIWRIQAQMVSDIAAAYGKTADLGREQMLWCMFRHTAAQAFRDLVVRMGDRLLFRRMSATVVRRVAERIGVSISQRAIGKGLARWLPLVGAVGVGGYAWYDTRRVADTAISLFSGVIELQPLEDDHDSYALRPSKPTSGLRAAAGRGFNRAVEVSASKVARAADKVAANRRTKARDGD